MRRLNTSNSSITVIVGSRIGPACLAVALENSPNSKFAIGVTPRADHEEVKQVLANFPDHRVELGAASDVLEALSAGVGASDWLLNLWGELIIAQAALSNCRSSLNIHPSMLPWARGSDPIVWTIANGWPAGATLHEMTSEVDAGPIWVQREVAYDFATSGGELYEKVLQECFSIFEEEWPRILSGELTARPQVPGEAPARRSQLHERRDTSLDEPNSVELGRFLRLIQAYDFGAHFSARVRDKGVLYRISVKAVPDPD